MRFDGLKSALLSVGIPVSHYKAHKQGDQYIVWAEDSQAAALWADNGMRHQVIQGTVHYFTKTEYDPNVERIQAAMSEAVSWRLNSIQHEDDTGYHHWEWVWEVV